MKTVLQALSQMKFVIFALVTSGVFSYLFYPLMNTDSMNALVSIYSILAGFLIGVISLLGDPMLIPKGSWRVAQAASSNTSRSLTSTKILLYIYLITLLLIFLHKVLFSFDGDWPDNMAFKDEMIAMLNWLSYYRDSVDTVILFFSMLAFLFSFKLPSKLYEIQRLRVEHEIETRRERDNIAD